jgi:DNA-binding response OmpR family regulator
MKTRILLVDDEPELLELLAEIFEAEGYEVHKARTPGEFCAQALAQRPHLIILDIDLGGANGPEVYRQLLQRGLGHHIPVIFLSGLVPSISQTPPATEGRRYAMHSKPFEQDRLVNDVRLLTKTGPPSVN